MIPNFKKQYFEPRLPLKREGGLLERCAYAWENAPIIQLATKRDWWGNAVGKRTVGSEYAELPEEPVLADGQFLARREALAAAALQQVQDNVAGINGITTEATNPYADRVDMEVRIDFEGVDEQIVIAVPGDPDALPTPPLPTPVYKDQAGAPEVWKDTAGDPDVYKDEVAE
jgi:phage gp46-like protein